MAKRTFRLLRNLVGLPVLLLLLFALLQTEPAKALLARQISRWLSTSSDVQVRVGGISGLIPADMRVASLEVGDARGTWLRAEGLRCHWMLAELVDRRIRLGELSAERMVIERFPEMKSRSVRVARGVGLVESEVDRLAIRQLVLGEQVAGERLEYSVYSGGLRLRPSGRVTGSVAVGGAAEGSVDLDAQLGGELKLVAELKALYKPDLGLDHISGLADMTVSSNGMGGTVLADLRLGSFAGQVDGGVAYRDGRLSLSGVEMRSAGNRVKGNAVFSFAPNHIGITGDAVVLDVFTNRYELSTQADLRLSQGAWALQFDRLDFRGFGFLGVSFRGVVEPDWLDLEGRLSGFPLESLPFAAISNVTGRVGGTVQVVGSFALPMVEARLYVSNLTSVVASFDQIPEVDLAVDARLADGWLVAETSVSHGAQGAMTFAGRMPCAFSVKPYRFSPEPKRLKAKMSGRLDLGLLGGLADLDDQHLAGRLTADLALDQTLPPAERVTGFLELEGGMYEHYDWGVVLQQVQARLEASPSGLVIKKASATDGGDGHISISGEIGLWQNPVPLNLSAQVQKARLIRRDDVEATLSGALQLGGLLTQPELTGTVVVDRADVLLDHLPPPAPPLLTDYNATATNQVARAKRIGGLAPVCVDVTVEMPDQVFINASVLDSVWGGKVTIKDLPNGLSVAGRINPRRGYFSFIGKKFRLSPDGWIELNGAVPPEPSLNIITEYTRSDIVARLSLVGRLENPHYRLTSDPALPEDEILSHVLFNRDTSSISAYQAYQIAAAARELTGGLRGPGLIYKVRQAIGVDTLEWRESETVGGASSVAAGKYLTPALYVEVNSSLDENEGTGVMAEYEITRHFSVETSTGAKLRPGIGVNWKNDY